LTDSCGLGIFLSTLLGLIRFPGKESGIQQQQFENEPQSRLPQIYADMFGWEERVRIVAAYYHSLSPEGQRSNHGSKSVGQSTEIASKSGG
jgi:hypothetical protein